MTDPTTDPLAEALAYALHEARCTMVGVQQEHIRGYKVAHAVERKRFRAVLAARGVYLVTEESLARAVMVVWGDPPDEDDREDSTELAAAILRSLRGGWSDD